MSQLAIAELRAMGPTSAIVDVADATLQFYIDEAEGEAKGILRNRGFDVDDAGFDGGAGWKLAIIKMVSCDVLGLNRGLAPDPSGHVFLVEARKEAVRWLSQVKTGDIGLGDGATARTPHGAARVFMPIRTTTGTRGW